MSIDSEMDEDNMVHIYNGILVNQKKKKEFHLWHQGGA